MLSTRRERPRTSERRMNSCHSSDQENMRYFALGLHTWRTSLHICPTEVKNCIAPIHSFVLNLVSRAKSCRCVTRRSSRYLNLGSGHLEFIMCTFSVMLSMVRSLRGGMSTLEGSMMAVAEQAGTNSFCVWRCTEDRLWTDTIYLSTGSNNAMVSNVFLEF